MRYVDEFRDAARARAVSRAIAALLARLGARRRALRIMEVCGGHTHAIFRYGIARYLPDAIEFVHGPGCPVCVLPRERIDACVALAARPGVIVATFGDALRVPGTRLSLLMARGEGADVRTVYSPLDALELARRNPQREVVFFALGFETTMPATALTVLQAKAEGLANFSLLCEHIALVPTLEALLDAPDLALDGLIAPGHVSMVIGSAPYAFIARDYGLPVVISGFEPLDLLQSLQMLLEQLVEGRARVANQYPRVVARDGNAAALAAMREVFVARASRSWRGLGAIANSGLRLRDAYAQFDAELRFALSGEADGGDMAGTGEPCQCGEVLRGRLKPPQCRLFATQCTPRTPQGALMVSSEGACAAYHAYAPLATVGDDDGRH